MPFSARFIQGRNNFLCKYDMSGTRGGCPLRGSQFSNESRDLCGIMELMELISHVVVMFFCTSSGRTAYVDVEKGAYLRCVPFIKCCNSGVAYFLLAVFFT